MASWARFASADESQEVRFIFRPTAGPASSYDTPQLEDQPLMVIYAGVRPGQPVPVVVGFHGQPGRGRAPRDYQFAKVVRQTVDALVETGALPPIVLVLPVFRFEGRNWPGMKPAQLRRKIDALLAERGLSASHYLAFGHSGAAGCGGDGLNLAHELQPRAVGFFDTCLGKGFADEIALLDKQRVATLVVHSVETAGFRPRQRPEYQANFDFGKVYAPLGLEPIACPKSHPGPQLRRLDHRCAASPSGTVKAFVIDTGEGEAAHEAALPAGLAFFLKNYLTNER